MPDSLTVIEADWPAPPGVRAVTTQRDGGVSEHEFASLNLGAHVGDDAKAVAENRRRIRTALSLPAEPRWLDQVHGAAVFGDDITGQQAAAGCPEADASVTLLADTVLAILTADCLPVALAPRDGAGLGIAHAGWRSLLNGVLENTVAAMGVPPTSLIAWLGPAIGPKAFEVGDEVRNAFVARDAASAAAFVANRPGHWLADLYALARLRLAKAGVVDVFGGQHCTLNDPSRFFSYRRDGQCGRMATLLWREGGAPCVF